MNIKALVFVACAALCASASYALADPMNFQELSATDILGNPSTTSGDAASIVNGGNGPELTANTSGGIAHADLIQYLTVTLPSDYQILGGDTYIPLTITYASSAVVSAGNSGGIASTSLSVNSFGGADFEFSQTCFIGYAQGCGSTGIVTQSFEFHYASKDYGVLITQPIGLKMIVDAQGANAFASLDPVIAFDPNAANSYLFPNGFTVTPSAVTPVSTSGLPTVSAAPEPSSWLLMVLGIGIMGSALKLCRRAGRQGLVA